MFWVALVSIVFGFGLAAAVGYALSRKGQPAFPRQEDPALPPPAVEPTELEQLASIEGGHYDRRVDRDGIVYMTMHYPDGSAVVGKGPTTKVAMEQMRALMLHHRRV